MNIEWKDAIIIMALSGLAALCFAIGLGFLP